MPTKTCGRGKNHPEGRGISWERGCGESKSSRRTEPVNQNQICQHKHKILFRGLFLQPSVSCFPVMEPALDHSEDMLMTLTSKIFYGNLLPIPEAHPQPFLPITLMLLTSCRTTVSSKVLIPLEIWPRASLKASIFSFSSRSSSCWPLISALFTVSRITSRFTFWISLS